MSNDPKLDAVIAEIWRILDKNRDVTSKIVFVSKTNGKSLVRPFTFSTGLDCEPQKDQDRLLYVLVKNKDMSRMILELLEQMGSEGDVKEDPILNGVQYKIRYDYSEPSNLYFFP